MKYAKELAELSKEDWEALKKEVATLRRKSKKKPFLGHFEELTLLAQSPQKHIRIIALYSVEKGVTFYSKEQVAEFISRNSRAAVILAGYPGKKIHDTIAYLKENADFKWTLESVVKYAEDIDNLRGKSNSSEVLGEGLLVTAD